MGKLAARIPAPTNRYELDYVGWTEDQARALRLRNHAGLDVENIAEEIESLGLSDKRAIGSHLAVILTHLLKWHYQPQQRSPGWSGSIDESRDQIEPLFESSPSLKAYPQAVLTAEYARARRNAARQTGLPISTFPPDCPFNLADVLASDWFPE